MDRELMEKRIRQLMAIDQNAFDIYTNLAKAAPDAKAREVLLALAIDESRHCEVEAEIMSLILKK